MCPSAETATLGTVSKDKDADEVAERSANDQIKPTKRRQCVGGTRKYYKFDGYHYCRPTQVYFRCAHCPYEEEVVDWLYVKSLQRWCLHLGKFHKCNRGPKKTVKCSQKILPEHAKGWPTISNDTAKKFLKADDLLTIAEAPKPEPLMLLPVSAPRTERVVSRGDVPTCGSGDKTLEGVARADSLTVNQAISHSVSRPKKMGGGLGRKRTLNGKFKPKIATSLLQSCQILMFEDILEEIDFTPFQNDTAQSSLLHYAGLDQKGRGRLEDFAVHTEDASAISSPSRREVKAECYTSLAQVSAHVNANASTLAYGSWNNDDAGLRDMCSVWLGEESSAQAVAEQQIEPSVLSSVCAPHDQRQSASGIMKPLTAGGVTRISNLQMNMFAQVMIKATERGEDTSLVFNEAHPELMVPASIQSSNLFFANQNQEQGTIDYSKNTNRGSQSSAVENVDVDLFSTTDLVAQSKLGSPASTIWHHPSPLAKNVETDADGTPLENKWIDNDNNCCDDTRKIASVQDLKASYSLEKKWIDNDYDDTRKVASVQDLKEAFAAKRDALYEQIIGRQKHAYGTAALDLHGLQSQA
jgi:hypothetical protein